MVLLIAPHHIRLHTDGLLFLESDVYQWNYLWIVLLVALKTEQVVVGAARSGRKLTANCGTGVINRAASGFGIDELASLFKQRVFLSAQHSLFAMHLRVTSSSNFFSHTEVLGESSNITRCYLDTLVN